MLEAEFTAAFNERAAAEPPPYDGASGQGVVICAGGDYVVGAWVLIGMLRRFGCTLPIEVWSLLEEDASRLAAFPDVTLRRANVGAGWPLKSHAIAHSAFREVLYIDADNVPVKDPTFLFQRPEYTNTGALFWTLGRAAGITPMWRLCELKPLAVPFFETGQIVVDKTRCWHALLLTVWMNQHALFVYDYTGGDANTFLLAWLKTETPFATMRHRPTMADGVTYQKDFDATVLFQHRWKDKWRLLGNRAIPGFQFETECLDLIAEFTWGGG